MTNDDDLLCNVAQGVATITLNRPQARNSLTPAYLKKLIAAVERCDADDATRVIVLRGAGKAFCSGADMSFLDDLTVMNAEQIRTTVYATFQGATRALRLCSKPVVAAVNGPAMGAGCELAVACDFRIASRDAVFCENWVDLGIMPPLGGLFLLPRLIGLERATDMAMRATRISGEEAKAIGLATEVAAPEEFDAAVAAFAAGLAVRSRHALRTIKQALRRGLEGTLAGEWEFNVQAQSVLLTGEDFKAAVAAIRERRAPEFK
jgi:enoyl-CoA hydratase/carnithine racemase